MTPEIDIAGIYISSVVLTAILAFLATVVVRRLLALTGLYRHLWHPALFDAALFFLLWTTAVLLPLSV